MPYQLIEGDCSYCDLCLRCETAEKARYGIEALFAYREGKGKGFGEIQSASKIYHHGTPKFKSLEDIQIVNKLFTKGRVEKKKELGREPLYRDVETETIIGGFKVKTPLVIGAMGSTDIANRRGIALGEGSANSGIVYVIGENVYNMRGYNERIESEEPTLKERILGFLKNFSGYGGVVIQQNVEDGLIGVWDKIFEDKDLQEYFEQGIIGFEAKGGQGAKPGMGGEVQVNKELALKLLDKYYFPVSPKEINQEKYQRHSVPGTLTPELLIETIEKAKEKYNKKYDVPIWFKTGPYTDIGEQTEIAIIAGADAITIDGTEGGTGMSPVCTMDNIGLPTIKCLQTIKKYKENHSTEMSLIIAGGIRNGGQIVKSLALGADAVAMGRPFIIAAETGNKALQGKSAKGIENFVEADTTEIKQIVSSLGKYNLKELDSEDVMSLDKDLAIMLNIKYIYDSDLF